MFAGSGHTSPSQELKDYNGLYIVKENEKAAAAQARDFRAAILEELRQEREEVWISADSTSSCLQNNSSTAE